jgi:hypothetical protein
MAFLLGGQRGIYPSACLAIAVAKAGFASGHKLLILLLSAKHKEKKQKTCMARLFGGQGGIRTPEGESQLVYSQSRLTAPEPTRNYLFNIV